MLATPSLHSRATQQSYTAEFTQHSNTAELHSSSSSILFLSLFSPVLFAVEGHAQARKKLRQFEPGMK